VTSPAGVDGVLAAHPLISAVPFFVPTFVVVAVIAVIVWRDRHRDGDADPVDEPAPHGHGEGADHAGGAD
jgi:hypothetical protein